MATMLFNQQYPTEYSGPYRNVDQTSLCMRYIGFCTAVQPRLFLTYRVLRKHSTKKTASSQFYDKYL